MISLSLYFFLYFMFLLRSANRFASTNSYSIYRHACYRIIKHIILYFVSYILQRSLWWGRACIRLKTNSRVLAETGGHFQQGLFFQSHSSVSLVALVHWIWEWLSLHIIFLSIQRNKRERSIIERKSKFIFLIYYRERNSLYAQFQSFPHLFSLENSNYKSMNNYYF